METMKIPFIPSDWSSLRSHSMNRKPIIDLGGPVKTPNPNLPCSTLWRGAKMVDDRMKALTMYAKGPLQESLLNVWSTSYGAASMVKGDKSSLTA